ncbi:MAG: EamA family transporter, partial [Bacteroidales bacterium]|nr:EamA family transporter [Bacteroidales bacterium]
MGGKDNRILLILHTAVFLAGWTGIFGRLISLGGLPLVWYRVIISVAILFIVMAALGKLQKVSRKEFFRIAGCGCLLALHWVAFYASIQASNVSVGVVCVATSCFFTALFNPLINRKRISGMELLISFIAITGVLLIFSLDVRYRLGIALGLLSSAIYSLFAIFNVNVAHETGRDSATMLLYELAGGVILLTVLVPLYTLVFPGEAVVPSRMN